MRSSVTVSVTLLVLGLVSSLARADDAVWSLAGKEVLRLHATIGGLTPVKRIEALDDRLNNILSHAEGKLGAEDIVLRKEKSEVAIFVRKELLVTVTAPDAEANKASREDLGKKWLANLRKTIPQMVPRVNKRGA